MKTGLAAVAVSPVLVCPLAEAGLSVQTYIGKNIFYYGVLLAFYFCDFMIKSVILLSYWQCDLALQTQKGKYGLLG